MSNSEFYARNHTSLLGPPPHEYEPPTTGNSINSNLSWIPTSPSNSMPGQYFQSSSYRPGPGLTIDTASPGISDITLNLSSAAANPAAATSPAVNAGPGRSNVESYSQHPFDGSYRYNPQQQADSIYAPFPSQGSDAIAGSVPLPNPGLSLSSAGHTNQHSLQLQSLSHAQSQTRPHTTQSTFAGPSSASSSATALTTAGDFLSAQSHPVPLHSSHGPSYPPTRPVDSLNISQQQSPTHGWAPHIMSNTPSPDPWAGQGRGQPGPSGGPAATDNLYTYPHPESMGHGRRSASFSPRHPAFISPYGGVGVGPNASASGSGSGGLTGSGSGSGGRGRGRPPAISNAMTRSSSSPGMDPTSSTPLTKEDKRKAQNKASQRSHRARQKVVNRNVSRSSFYTFTHYMICCVCHHDRRCVTR